jgi:hypothetical protein
VVTNLWQLLLFDNKKHSFKDHIGVVGFYSLLGLMGERFMFLIHTVWLS